VLSSRAFGWIVLSSGTALFCIGLWLVWDGGDGGNWSRVSGTVLASDVETSFSFSDFRFRFRPVVTFEYCVDGRKYRASATAATWRQHREDDVVSASGAAMDHVKGSRIDVFHRRDDPEWAALKPGPRNWHLWLLAIGLVVAIVGAIFLRAGGAGEGEVSGR